MKHILRAAVLSALLTPAALWASGWGALMKDSPMGDFNDEDVRAYLEAIQSLLNTPLPAAPVEWRNERTGAGAHLEIIGQPQIENYEECRRVQAAVYSKKRKGSSRVWTACRDASGGWRLVTAH